MTDSARALLRRGLDELCLEASDEQRATLIGLAGLLETWARRINLTGHHTLDAIVERLILEAAALLATLPSLESVADLGSGAGFPGLPIAILRPDVRVTLVESRSRRHHFQRAAIRELGIPNALPVLGRAEELESQPHAVVIAQAMARPARALRWMVRWAAPGGLLILPAAERPPEIPQIAGLSVEEPIRYSVPCGGPRRTLLLARRVG